MPASAMKTFQEAAEKQAKAIVKEAPAAITSWQADCGKLFPHANLSSAADSFQKDGNGSLATALAATVNLVDKVSSDLTALEQYITLTVPQMEDGNNFGVAIQMSALKTISEAREKVLDKALEDLTKYSSSRADALEKCKLPSVSITETSTVSESKGEENKEAKVSKSESKETKSVSSKTEASDEMVIRQQAVTAVDLLYYSKAKTIYTRTITAYLAALDFYEKNAQKITKPKGDKPSGGYSSMY